MARCELIDYADRNESLAPLVEYHRVTPRNMETLRAWLLPDQMAQVEDGDEIAVYRIDNTVEGITGTLIVWYNKEMACIDTGSGSDWGDWDESAELVVTEEFGEAEDPDGVSVAGRIAFNIHGIRGILTGDDFHTLDKETYAR